MSKSTFVFLLAVILSFSQSMASGISLQFEARYACGHTSIDSILVENLSRQTSVVLYYPDTVIDSAPVSVVTLQGNGNTMHVSQNYPNPFTGRTSVDVFVPRSDWVTLRVFDISGRLLALYESQLEPGMHHFEFHSSDRQHYLLSVSSNHFHEQRLMIQLGRGSRQQPELVYAGMGAQMMSGQDAEFYFQSGDDMRYTAYVTAPGGEVVYDTKEDTPVGSTVYLFEMAEEVPARPSEIQGPAMVSAQATGLEYEVDHVPGVHYEWTLPQGWEITSGAGQSLITVNAGNQAGTLTVVASNDCGSSAERTFDVEMEYLLTLDVDPAEAGNVAGAGEYVAGQPVSVSANPAPGFEFVAWKDAQDAVVSTQAGYTFDMPAENLHLTARFQALSFNLTLAVNSDFEGQASGEGTFTFNESVTVTATPEPGFSLLYWEDETGAQVSTDAHYTFSMPAEDVSLTAFFGVVDADGDTYNYTTINGRQWLSQNLRTTKYADGSDITQPLENAAWSETTEGAYAILPHDMVIGVDSDSQLVDAFGKLYNHYAVTDGRGLCPAGWSVPAAADFQGLFDYLGDEYGYLPGMVDMNDPYKSISYALRSCRQVNSPLGDDCDTQEQPRWHQSSYAYAADPFGFSAFPGGLREFDGVYHIDFLKSYPHMQEIALHHDKNDEMYFGIWWSATPGYHMILASFMAEFDYSQWAFSNAGLSVRCIRDKDFYSLVLSHDPEAGGTVSGGGDFAQGQQVSVDAVPNPGFAFIHWLDAFGEVVSTEAEWTFEMPNFDMTLTAVFELVASTVTVETASAFEGSVSGGGEYMMGEDVIVTATPESGFSFLYWEDEAGTQVSNDAQYTFTMPAEDVSLTAFFGVVDADGNTYNYTTINGRQWLSQNLRTTRYADGSDIPDLVENAAWSGTTQGAYGVVPHNMITGIDSGAQMADAFGKLYNHYAVTDSRGLCPTGWSVPAAADFQGLFDYLGDEYGYLPGMVDVNDPYKSIPYALRSCRQVNSPLGGDCDTQDQPRWPLDPYTYGGDPFGFSAFSGGLRNVDGSYYIEPFKSYPQLQDHAWHSKNEGELSIGFWWSATPGYHMVLANFIGEFVYTENTMYTPGMSVRCIRDKDFYSLVLSHDPEAGGTVSGGGDFAQGQQVSVDAVPNSGFAFIHWLDAFGKVVSTEASWSFEMPNHDLNLTAIFEAVISAVTVETASAFEGSVSGGGEFNMGEDVTVTATPEPGFSLLYWEDETGAQVSTDAQYTFSMPAEDVTLTAFFGVVDAGGNTYSYTTINGRQWLSENLRTPVYNDGTPIARPQDAGEWSAATTGAYAVLPHGYLQGLNSDADVVAAYGKLYNYRVVQDDRGVCPAGWSIASHYNYLGLFEYLELEYGLTLDGYFLKDDAPGHSKNAGHALSSCRQVNSPLGDDCTTTEHPRWSPFVDDVYGWDQFGFAALPAGFRDNDGYFISAPLKKGDQLAKMSPAKDYFDENYMDIAGFWAAGKVTLVGFSSFASFFDHYPEDDYWFDAAFASGAALRCIRDKGTYSVQLTSEPLDGGVLAGAGDYALGQQVSITAEAAPGFAFTHWQNGLGHVVSTEASWTFEMPNHDLNLTAVFEAAISNTVSVATAAAIEGSVSGGGEYMMGEDVTVTATPESGFTFLHWEDDAGTQVSTEAQYTFSMPAEDLTLTAIFGVVDADGNTYGYTTINGRQWLSENLRTTKYADGSSIPYLVKDTDWEETTGGAYAVLPHDMVIGLDSGTQVVDAFGKLYNHHAVADSRGLCPAGWSVPPAADYQSLFDYLINVHGYLPGFVYDPYKAQYLPNALRSCRQLGSPLGDDCNTGVQPRWFEDTNSYSSDPFGWSGLPGGARDYDGRFMTSLTKSSLQNHEFTAHAPKTNEIIISLFWSANPEAFLLLSSFWAEIFTYEKVDEFLLSMGMSVRCIRNNP
jgi:uncharacterized protein (TIGR02145 family)